jgi:type VI secretion system protein ImpL
MAPDGTLVASARTALTRVPLAKRSYAQLRRAGLDQDIPGFNIIDAAGDDAPLVFRRASGKSLNSGIPGLYTYRGYYQKFLPNIRPVTKQVAGEGWVLGVGKRIADEKAQAKLIAEVQKLYFEDYVRKWNTLVKDIEIVAFTSLPQAVEVLNILAGTPSPLRRLMEGIERETALDRPPGKVASLAEKAEKRLIESVAGLLGEDASQAVVPSSRAPKNYVATRFAGIHREVRARGESPPPIDRTMAQIEELYITMHAVARAADRGDLVKVAREQADAALERLELDAKRKPSPLKDWMRALATQSHTLVGVRVTQTLNLAWVDTVLGFCRNVIKPRFPFDRRSQTDVGIDDFSRFFGPGGIMEQFFKERLIEFVDTSRRPWRVRTSGGVKLRISRKGLQTFQQAAVIRETFFPGGGDQPLVKFSLKPVRMDGDITNFVLDLEGQTLTYRHGPVRPHQLTWPGSPDSAQEVRIQITLRSEGGRSSWTEEGAWAWFRMLDKAQVAPGKTPEKFQITFDLDGRLVVYELRARSAFNPFRLKELEQFQCPARL